MAGTETHVHKSTYRPLIDRALYVMLLMRANPLLGQVGGGLGPGNLNFFGTHMALDAISQGPKSLDFPLPLALVMAVALLFGRCFRNIIF